MSTTSINRTRLVICRDSWHYKYYEFIRSFWGFEPQPRTSLCPYCQTMIWFSLLAILLSPIFVIGWIILKLFRTTYKVLSKRGYNKLIDLIDKSFLEEVHNDLTSIKTPIPTIMIGSFMFFIAVIAAIILFCLLLYGIGHGVWSFIFIIPKIPAFLVMCLKGTLTGLIYVGFGIWIALASVGYALVTAYTHVVHFMFWLFTNKHLWFNIGYWSLFAISIIVITTLISLLIWKLSQTSLGKKVIEIIRFKANGYAAAREQAEKRREEETRRQEKILNDLKKNDFQAWLALQEQEQLEPIEKYLKRVEFAAFVVIAPFYYPIRVLDTFSRKVQKFLWGMLLPMY